MIILDTNVLSELMKAVPHPAVFDWVATQPSEQLYTTSVSKAEILYGIATLPRGRRRAALAAAAEAVFAEDLADRVLPFDSIAAGYYGDVVAARRRAGRPIEGFDAQIAAIALVFGGRIATRNVADFADCGATVINPWDVP